MEPVNHASDLYNVAEVELIYKSKVKASQRPQILSSKDAYAILSKAWEQDKIELVEQFKVMFQNRGNKVLGIFNVSTGGMTGTVADPRIILVAALKANCCGIILCHNHPSGSLKPSRQDQELTQKIKSACQFLEIKLLDHLIITAEAFHSFADDGLL